MNVSPLIEKSGAGHNFQLAKVVRKELDCGSRSQKQIGTDSSEIWQLTTFSGRFGELSGDKSGAALTLVFRLVLDAQKQGEPVAWITPRQSIFFPPDAAEAGIHLGSMAVIRAPDTLGTARVAEHLLRSGAFGLIVMDLGTTTHLPLHAQSRLAGQARRHATALVCLTEKQHHQPSLGSLVSLRIHTAKKKQNQGHALCEARFLKDKRQGPGRVHMEVFYEPDGLR
jgi:recombination protein RecA